MIRVQGSTFKHAGIELDDMEYVDCRFEQCRVIYRGGPLPRFGGKTAFIGCQIVFEEAAADTMKLLELIAKNGNPELVQDIFRSILGPQN